MHLNSLIHYPRGVGKKKKKQKSKKDYSSPVHIREEFHQATIPKTKTTTNASLITVVQITLYLAMVMK